jgi:glycosyltransferase involved in cell wall biosynthesis
MKISVIIPTLNRRSYVLDLLDDIAMQDLEVFEVIVSDQSANFLKIEKKYPFKLNHFKHTGRGPCCSRNDAAKISSGEILVFLDDDARIMTEFVRELVKPIKDGIVQVSTGAICDASGNYTQTIFSNNLFKNDTHWLIAFTKNPNHSKSQFSTGIPAGCMAIKNNIFRAIGGFDLYFDPNGAWEDREFALRLLSNGYGIFYNAKAKLYHLGEENGGRRSFGNENTPMSFKKNLAYVLLKYFNHNDFRNYVRGEIMFRINRIARFNMVMYNWNELLKFLKIVKKIKKDFSSLT